MKKTKLNLGCYDRKIPDFINVDIREDVNPDLLDDVFALNKIKNNSVDLIYACHVLEHADYKRAVPDMEAHFAHYFYHKDLRALHSTFWGSQRHPYDYHKNGWDFNKLKEDLTSVGFTTVKRYDWRKTEHFYIDDYSQSYSPHMDKENGKLMSLNVEAIKI